MQYCTFNGESRPCWAWYLPKDRSPWDCSPSRGARRSAYNHNAHRLGCVPSRSWLGLPYPWEVLLPEKLIEDDKRLERISSASLTLLPLDIQVTLWGMQKCSILRFEPLTYPPKSFLNNRWHRMTTRELCMSIILPLYNRICSLWTTTIAAAWHQRHPWCL